MRGIDMSCDECCHKLGLERGACSLISNTDMESLDALINLDPDSLAVFLFSHECNSDFKSMLNDRF